MKIIYPKNIDTPEFREVFEEWIANRIELKNPATSIAIKLQLKKLSAFTIEECIDAIESAILHNWQGIFPKKLNKFEDTLTELEEGL